MYLNFQKKNGFYRIVLPLFCYSLALSICKAEIDFYYANTLDRISIKKYEWKRLNTIEYYDIKWPIK